MGHARLAARVPIGVLVSWGPKTSRCGSVSDRRGAAAGALGHCWTSGQSRHWPPACAVSPLGTGFLPTRNAALSRPGKPPRVSQRGRCASVATRGVPWPTGLGQCALGWSVKPRSWSSSGTDGTERFFYTLSTTRASSRHPPIVTPQLMMGRLTRADIGHMNRSSVGGKNVLLVPPYTYTMVTGPCHRNIRRVGIATS